MEDIIKEVKVEEKIEGARGLLETAMQMLSMAKQLGKPVIAWPDGRITIMSLENGTAHKGKKSMPIAKAGKEVMMPAKQAALPIFADGSWTMFGVSGKLVKLDKRSPEALEETLRVSRAKWVFAFLRKDNCLPEPIERRTFRYSTVEVFELEDGLYFADKKSGALVEYVCREGIAWFSSHLAAGHNAPTVRSHKKIKTVPGTGTVVQAPTPKAREKTEEEKYPHKAMVKSLEKLGATVTPWEDVSEILKGLNKPAVKVYLHTMSGLHIVWHTAGDLARWLATKPDGVLEVWAPTPMTWQERQEAERKAILDRLK